MNSLTPPLIPAPYSKDYEITDAMFGAFRSSGGATFFWKLFAWGALAYTLVGLVLIPPMLSSYIDFFRMAVEVEGDPDSSFELLMSAGKFFGVIMLVSIGWIALASIIRAAFFRGYFFGEVGGVFPFQFGMDEVRLILASLGFYGLFILLMIVSPLILVIPFALLFWAGHGVIAVLAIILMILFYIGMIVLWIWFGIKFLPAGALTAYRGQVHVLAARHVTKNRFWALFGSMLVVWLIGYVVSNVATTSGLLIAFSGLSGGDIFSFMTGADPERLLDAIERASETASFKFASLLAILFVGVGYSFCILLYTGPSAFFTQQWASALEADLLPSESSES